MKILIRTALIIFLLHSSPVIASVWSEAEPLFKSLQDANHKLALVHTTLKGIIAASPRSPEDGILLSFKVEIEKASIILGYFANGLTRWEEIEKRGNVPLNCQFELESIKLHMNNLGWAVDFTGIAKKTLQSESALELLNRFDEILLHVNEDILRYGELLNKTYKANWKGKQGGHVRP